MSLTLETPIIQRMRERCENFLPSLKNAALDPVYPLAQGLRPFRAQNVRVERELRKSSRIIHSYGQGGAGWSLSFGCAEDVLKLVEVSFFEIYDHIKKAFSTDCRLMRVTGSTGRRLCQVNEGKVNFTSELRCTEKTDGRYKSLSVDSSNLSYLSNIIKVFFSIPNCSIINQ